MAIPFVKAFITASRLFLRPLNNMLIKRFQTIDHTKPSYRFFVWFGQKSNIFETKMNRVLVGSKGLSKIPDLADTVAFKKGIEWFTEIFFFYGLLGVFALYEIDKFERSYQS
jgi:hypothetical protein